MNNYLDLPDQIRAIAQLGLNYAKDEYDLERYRRCRGIVRRVGPDVVGRTEDDGLWGLPAGWVETGEMPAI